MPFASVLLALTLLAGAIAAGAFGLRAKLREESVNRDGEVIGAVTMMQYLAEQYNDPEATLDKTETQFTVLLKASFLQGVMGARLFDAKGNFVTSFPQNVKELRIDKDEVAQLRSGSIVSGELQSVSAFHPDRKLADDFLIDPREAGKAAPVLIVTVPLHKKGELQLFGVAQMIIDGTPKALEFAEIDRSLAARAASLFLICGALMTATLWWAFARLARANAELAARSESLLKANQELAMMARTSAVGAVAANLMHGLKSPLFGLINLFAAWRAADTTGEKVEWHTAVDTARRMQAMVNGVMDFVRDQEGLSNHEVTMKEMLQAIGDKVTPLAAQNDVRFDYQGEVNTVLAARVSNLLTMILINLIQNAIEATPSGKQVRLSVRQSAQEIEFEVADEGGGLRPELERQLFQPCESSKEGGSGLGLAICKQLARHLGADLNLRQNTSKGCVFGLVLPPELSAASTGET
ncbi:MAG TPA: HAMP domain-containing sensor histidine kinase [Verrucomicrobiae bacterium]